MPDEVKISARAVPVRIVLKDPWKFEGRPIIVLETTPTYLHAMRKFAADHDMTNLSVTFAEYPAAWTERARNFMFMVRDKLAEAAHETSREYKEHLYAMAKRECGLKDMHLADMSREEVSRLINQFMDWAAEAEVDQTGFAEELKALEEAEDERE